MDHDELEHPAAARLLRDFAQGVLPPAQLGHREHLHLGWLYLRRHADLGAAAVQFRGDLRRYVAAHGAQGRYHETITWAYLVLLAARQRRWPELDFAAVLAREPALLDHQRGTLARHYDVAALHASGPAAAGFLLPGEMTS